MKRRAFVFTVATLAMLVTASAAQAGAPSTPFSGTWMGQDPMPDGVGGGGDGSWNHLEVRGGNNARVTFEDEFGSVCWDALATDFWFSSSLNGSVSGNTMTGVFKSAKCGHMSLGWMKGSVHTWTFNDQGTADPADDTLSDGYVTFGRV